MGGALRHALRWGLATTVVVGGLAGLPMSPSSAVSTGRPIAVAVAGDGTSYAGFAAGGRLLRLSPSGEVIGSVPLDRAEPVTGLDVDSAGTIWVDYGSSVSQLAPDGELLTHFAHQPDVACPADLAHDPARYGGIEASGDRVWVANRCVGTVSAYSRSGELQLTLDLPGSGYPRGIAVSQQGGGVPARLYVSVPAQAKVFVYNLGGLKASSDPVRTLKIEKDKPNYVTPEPGGIAADTKGQLIVLDVANNALYFYDGTKDYHFYRTLGHPPTAAPDKGYLDAPASVDQAGEALQAHIWVADTGNGRIQRWDTDGTTQWMTDARPPGDAGAPVNTAPPEISGTPYLGSRLDCSTGGWDGGAVAYAFGWLRDGLPIVGAGEASYVVAADDVSSELSCTVVATGAGGASSAPAASDTFPIPGASSPPYVVTRPQITGTPTPGSVLHCSPGTWTDPSPDSYVRGWLRDGQLLPGTNGADYLVGDSDLYHELTCRVAASNEHGTGKVSVSDPVAIVQGPSNGGISPPENSRRPSIVGDPVVGEELFCDPGRWEGAPVFTYAWRRDGELIGGSQNERYTVASDDKGRLLTCAVTGTNPAGSATAVSPAVVPTKGTGPGTDPGTDPGTGSGKTCRGKPSVVIDKGRRYARDRWVVLRIRAPRAATGVEISNDAKFRHADTRALRESCNYKWTIGKHSGSRPKTVWVRFAGATGRIKGSVSDDVVLDSAAPRVHGVSVRWRTSWWSWVLTVHASDKGSGLARVEVGHSKHDTRTVKWGRPVNDADRSKLRWVRVLDRAGNPSAWYRIRGR